MNVFMNYKFCTKHMTLDENENENENKQKKIFLIIYKNELLSI